MAAQGVDYSKVPAMQPPPGQHSNFVDPPSAEKKLLIVNSVFTSLMVVMVAVRLVIKGPMTRVLWWDDYTCFAAAICAIIHAVVMMEQCEVIGYGRHMWDIPASRLMDKNNLRLLSANNIVYIVTIFLAKVSMLLLYLRIFPKSTRLGRWIVGMIVFLGAFTVGMLGTAIASELKCITPASQTTELCHNISTNLIIFQASITVATDFYVLVLPIPPFFRVLLQAKRKLLIALIFVTGLVACAASTTRLGLFVANEGKSDILWVEANTSSLYSIVEITTAVIAGCLLNLPALFDYTRGLALRAYSSVASLLSAQSPRPGSVASGNGSDTKDASEAKGGVVVSRGREQDMV